MKTFKEAYYYLNNTSVRDVFIRVVPYSAWAEVKNRPIRYTPFVILLCSYAGPFIYDNCIEDPVLNELLETTDYGNDPQWQHKVDQWLRKHCKTDDDWYYCVETARIVFSIQNDVADLLDNNARKQRHRGYYLPELVPFGFNSEHWPRI